MNESAIMRFFQYEHLPPHLQRHSRPFAELAAGIDAKDSQHPAEKATALRKLLEAKDAYVRAMLP